MNKTCSLLKNRREELQKFKDKFCQIHFSIGVCLRGEGKVGNAICLVMTVGGYGWTAYMRMCSLLIPPKRVSSRNDGLSWIPCIRLTKVHTLLKSWSNAGVRGKQCTVTSEAGAEVVLPLLESGCPLPNPSPQALCLLLLGTLHR